MRTLLSEWCALEARIFPFEPPPIQLQEMRRAFYAGAQAMLGLLDDVAGPEVSEEAAMALLESYQAECTAFGEAVAAGKA